MMNVSGINGTNTQTGQMGILKKTDSVSKDIQNQIENAQKRLQELSSNKEMDMEEKMEKRKEIQEQINDLNKQLRQHEFEQRREKQQAKGSSTENISNESKRTGKTKAEKQGAGLSQASMTAMISADSAKGQAQALGNVVTQLEGRKDVLGAEIEQDARRGRDVTKKQEEYQDLEDRVMEAEASQIDILGKANKEMTGAAKTDQEAEVIESTAEKTVNEEKKAKGSNGEKEETNLLSEIYYTPIDIRL